jgi:hypothetical protein
MTKSRLCKWIFIGLVFFAGLLRTADSFSQETSREVISPPETEKKISGGVSTDFVSKYVWRGIPLSEGPVMQSEGWFSAYGANVVVWSNLDLGESELNEIDLQTSYRYQWKNLSVEPILLFYFFPNQGGAPPTGEAGFKLSYSLGPFQFTTGHAFDFMEFGGAYFGAVAAGYQREFTSYFSLETAAGIGWANSQFNEAYLGVPHGALNVFQWSLALTFSPCRYLFVTPHLKVSSLLDGRLQGQVSRPTNVSGGFQLGVEF